MCTRVSTKQFRSRKISSKAVYMRKSGGGFFRTYNKRLYWLNNKRRFVILAGRACFITWSSYFKKFIITETCPISSLI